MSIKQRKKMVWWIGLFITSEAGLIPTMYRTDQGVYLQQEPIAEFDYRDRDQLAAAMRHAMETGNPNITADPSEQKKRIPDIQKRMKAKSWQDVERRSIYFCVECLEDEFLVTAWGRASDGTWSEEKQPALARHLPLNGGIESVVHAIWQHLQERTDLPGLPIGGERSS